MYGTLLRFFFFTSPATSEIYTLSLHDALPICDVPNVEPFLLQHGELWVLFHLVEIRGLRERHHVALARDRKSTRLNSSHSQISYAVFCLKKKKKEKNGNSPRQSRLRKKQCRHY